jgi:hypothetical protein
VAELHAQEQPAKELAEAQKQAKELDARGKDLQQQLERAHREAVTLAAQRHRHSRLLAILGRERSDDLIVQKLDAPNGELTLHGTCLKPEVADRLAQALVKESQDLHWEVLPSNKKALGLLDNGGPWAFDLTLKDLPFETGPATTSARPGANRR